MNLILGTVSDIPRLFSGFLLKVLNHGYESKANSLFYENIVKINYLDVYFILNSKTHFKLKHHWRKIVLRIHFVQC